MDDHLRKQIEDVLKRIDEQPQHTTEEDKERTVHVYVMDGGSHKGGSITGRGCKTVLASLPKRIMYLIGVCILLSCMGFLFSLFPVITTTTTTIASTTASITMQQNTLGPTGVALMIGGLALLTGFLILERKPK